jgi:hypothetical protein
MGIVWLLDKASHRAGCHGFELDDVGNPTCQSINMQQLGWGLIALVPWLLRYAFLGLFLLCLLLALRAAGKRK